MPYEANSHTFGIALVCSKNSQGLMDKNAAYLYLLSIGGHNGPLNDMKFYTQNISSTKHILLDGDKLYYWSRFRYDVVNDVWVREFSGHNAPAIKIHGVTDRDEALDYVIYSNINFYTDSTFTNIWRPANTWNI